TSWSTATATKRVQRSFTNSGSLFSFARKPSTLAQPQPSGQPSACHRKTGLPSFSACCAASTIEMCQGIDFHGSTLGGCSASKMVGKLASVRWSVSGAAGVFCFCSETAEPASQMLPTATTLKAANRNLEDDMVWNSYPVDHICRVRPNDHAQQRGPPAKP